MERLYRGFEIIKNHFHTSNQQRLILQEICKKIYFYAILPSLVIICNATIVIITIILQIIYTSNGQV